MRLLLDTHTFIWWDSDPDQLSDRVLSLLSDREHELLLSVISLWEMQIKSQLGKLTLRLPMAEIVAGQQARNQLVVVPFELDHVLRLDDLPAAHRDPFDRALVAQALALDAHLVSHDPLVRQYPVNTIW